MEFKDYQQRVIDTLDAYLDELTTQRAKAQKVKQANASETDPDLIRPLPDFPKRTWDVMKANGRLPGSRQAIDYGPRIDGTGQCVPNICFKIPTGGGKTLLATAAVSRIMGRFVSSNTGFVLWIVPNDAIYTQTRKHLANREHPYRQMLDRAAAGKVKLLEKADRLDRRDVDTHLCVMLLMLQSANRETKETLRLFRDRGNVHGFFPSESEGDAHGTLLKSIPNLDAYAQGFWPIVKDSLGNVLRFIRPLVVMDEGHKAYSVRALETLYGFNPSFVLELSATPPNQANWLVDVRGKELADEEMIKLPINVKVKSSDDWRDALRESLDLLNNLQVAADALNANTARYVRPIMLVQVERTGRDQRDTQFVHAEDAKEFLLAAGLAEREIAIKTSEVNDLKALEKQDLLSPINTVRVIITKQALQEGWDCPFAYVLCALAASRNMRALTQLVGRILRQPHAAKTDVALLDECYVICHHVATREVLDGIKKGLEEDGMGDLARAIKNAAEGNGTATTSRKIQRRGTPEIKDIFLPVVNWVDGEEVRALDYEQDVLMRVDWSRIKMDSLSARIPGSGNTLQTFSARITVTAGAGSDCFHAEQATPLYELTEFDPVYATRIVSDIVPNPWIARKLIGDLLGQLKGNGFDDRKLGVISSLLLEELRKFLIAERDKLAEQRFLADVTAERIQFRLRTDRHNWTMPEEMETELSIGSTQLIRPSGTATEKSLFAPTYEDDYNNDEAEFACYLDERKALQWWHRNVAKAGQYHIQGWRKNKVYPDFVFALLPADGEQKLVVMETKGDQLQGNLDTEYKRKLLKTVNDNYRFRNVVKAGELEIVIDAKTTVACDLVLMSDWKTRVPNEYFN